MSAVLKQKVAEGIYMMAVERPNPYSRSIPKHLAMLWVAMGYKLLGLMQVAFSATISLVDC